MCIYGGARPLRGTIGLGMRIAVIEMNNDTNMVSGIGLIHNELPDMGKHIVYSTQDYNRYLYKGSERQDRKVLMQSDYWNPKRERQWGAKTPLQLLEFHLFKGKGHMKRGSGVTTIVLPEELEDAIVDMFCHRDENTSTTIPSAVQDCLGYIERLSLRVAALEDCIKTMQSSLSKQRPHRTTVAASVSPDDSVSITITPCAKDLDIVAASNCFASAAARVLISNKRDAVTGAKGIVFLSGSIVTDATIKDYFSHLRKDLQRMLSKKMCAEEHTLTMASACIVSQQLFKNLYEGANPSEAQYKMFRSTVCRAK